jgi:hypothetical protein
MQTSSTTQWTDTQHKTFVIWVNTYLSRCKPSIQIADISSGLSNGINLVLLIQQLLIEQQDPKNERIMNSIEQILPKLKRGDNIRHLHCIDNCICALQLFDTCISDEMKNTNRIECSAKDLAEGNLKLIMGLVWMLILKFRIKLDTHSSCNSSSASDADEPASPSRFVTRTMLSAEQDMLKYVSKQLALYSSTKEQPEVNNFTSSWQSGYVLARLVQSIDKNFLSRKRLSEYTPVELNQKACEYAVKTFHIPPLIEAIDLTSNPEKFSIMMFVSYLCEYQQTQEREQIQMRPIFPKLSPQRVRSRVSITLDEIEEDAKNDDDSLLIWFLVLLAIILIVVNMFE